MDTTPAREPPEEPGFRPVGSLVPTNGNSRKASGSTPMSSARSSETSGSVCPVSGAASSIGLPPSGTAVAKLPAVAEQARQALTERESQRLVAASLERLLGSLPAVSTRSWTAEDGQFDSEITSIDLPNASPAALEQAWREVEALCRPASSEPNGEALVAQEWARTIAVTAGTQRQGVDEDLAVEVIVGEVAQYPLDCVMRAMRVRRNGYRWRPTLSELLGDIQWRARYRTALREAFQRAGVEAAP